MPRTSRAADSKAISKTISGLRGGPVWYRSTCQGNKHFAVNYARFTALFSVCDTHLVDS